MFRIMLVLFFAGSAFGQSLVDPNLRVQTYLSGLSSPTGAVFLNDSGDALITQKNDGKVLLVRNRQIVGTVLDLPVANDSERGLLSIALSPNFATDNRVYLYHTVAAADGGAAISNKISRFRWTGSQLVFDRKIIDLPPGPGPNHDGGKIVFDAKGKLYAVIGDLNRNEVTSNFQNSGVTNRIGAVIRLQPSGGVITTNPFYDGGARTPNDDIFAYGIRNSFGIAFDPVTGALWDTENGPNVMDEINRVSPGFNSGWEDIMGPVGRSGGSTGGLASLGPRAFYSDPEFSWADPVAPTDLHFFPTSHLGSAYRNDLFVGDVKTGSIFHFNLSSTRRSLVLDGALADLVADNTANLLDEQDSIIFGSGFGVVSDLLSGPGGMFALSLSNGRLYRISQNPAEARPMSFSFAEATAPEPCVLGILSLLLVLRRPR